MYYTGLIPKFKIDRPLSDEDRKRRLRQDKKVLLEPTSALSVTRLNSTYLEIADKYYPWKGGMTAVMFVCACLSAAGPLASAYIIFISQWVGLSASERNEAVIAFLIIFVVGAPVAIFAIWLLLKDSFRYTHYPIRLNRKTRMVYVFRFDGAVLEAAWDDLFITIAPAGASKMFVDGWDLRAHVLDKDGETVRETFAFGYVADPENLRHYFAYLQRYMDEGPEAVAPYTLDCLDIVDRRETAVFGFKRLWLNFGLLPFQLLMLPLLIPSAIGRVIAMRTSKIPQWPAEVEAANRIEPGDPWVRDARTHPAR